MLTQSRLKKLLHYDPEMGVFTRLLSRGPAHIGSVAGCINTTGYLRIRVDGKSYRSHRLVFLYLYGELPHDQVDHINGIKNDNRRVNLRRCDHSTNQRNQRKRVDNASGIVGVSWDKSSCKWLAYIGANGKIKHLGRFTDKSEAISAREAAEVKYRYHENHGRNK